MTQPDTGWVDEDDDWEDEEWMFVVPWHVRFRLWLQFWKR
jgi:hypothetical protein